MIFSIASSSLTCFRSSTTVSNVGDFILDASVRGADELVAGVEVTEDTLLAVKRKSRFVGVLPVPLMRGRLRR